MDRYEGDERRQVERTDIVTFCPTTFEHDGGEREALMIQVSELGARLQIERSDTELSLRSGEELTYRVRTPYGEAVCRARTVWAQHIGKHYTWGVEFTELSQDKNDPLRALIDSPF